jgi:hypothetical protein
MDSPLHRAAAREVVTARTGHLSVLDVYHEWPRQPIEIAIDWDKQCPL